MKIYVGCSGFYYNDWKEKFYPPDLPKKQWLEFYSAKLNTVEINNTFYRIPAENSFSKWYAQTPVDFRFTVKGNRYITHMKKLKQDNELRKRIENFENLALKLKEKLGCILWQLPGNLRKNKEKLSTFCHLLNKDIHHVLEFRDKSWFDEEVYEILSSNKVSYCMLSAPGDLPENILSTSEIAYVRFHGKTDWYNYNYSRDELEKWKNGLLKLKATELYAYFNNDHNAYAASNSIEFSDMLKD